MTPEEIAGTWRRKVYKEPGGGQESTLGVSFSPIPEDDKVPLWSTMMDVGIGRSFGCILTHLEASHAVTALVRDGWEHVKEDAVWKL